MENLNIFGKNQEEIGSLDKNLVLRTKGRVYIRFGRKYIELIDDKGNINVKIPKVLTKVDSKDKIKGTGFFLFDGDLYACYEDEIIQITGVEGSFISYAIEQNLTQENFDVAQKNIGLKFKNIKDAQKAVTEGIVFIGDKIYYINKGTATELFVLNDPIDSINNAELGMPSKNLSVIIFKDGKWVYDQVVTLEYYNKYLKPKSSEDEEEYEEKEDSFDLIEYSKRYNLTKFEFQYEKTVEGKKISSATFDTTPSHNLQDGDICIISLRGYLGNEDGTPIELKHNVFQEEAVVFQFKYESGELKLIDKKGNPQEILLKNDSQGELQYFEYNGKIYTFIGTLQDNLDSRKNHLYVKAEESNPKKFKIDYQHAEIALEENYPKDEETGKTKIIPHTVLGDLTDESGYYNENSVPFRTYEDRKNTQGLYSDQAVFNGTEFRGEYPDETKNIQKAYNYPRYSKLLNAELCNNHKMEDIEDGDPFENVVPTIKWIKSNALKRPLKDINNTEFNTFEPESETYTNQDLNITVTIPNGIVYDSFQQKWRYEKVVPFNLFKTCCETVMEKLKEIEANKEYTISWLYEKDGALYTTTIVKNKEAIVEPGTNPSMDGYEFVKWDYNQPEGGVTSNMTIIAEWKEIVSIFIEVDPEIVPKKTDTNATVTWWVKKGKTVITDNITVTGKYNDVTFTKVGEKIINEGQNVKQTITVKKEETIVTPGTIDFTASYTYDDSGENKTITAIAQLIQQDAYELPDFDLMKFHFDWNSGDLDQQIQTSNTGISNGTYNLDDIEAGLGGYSYYQTLSTKHDYRVLKDDTIITLDEGTSKDDKKDYITQYIIYGGDSDKTKEDPIEEVVINFGKILREITKNNPNRKDKFFIYFYTKWWGSASTNPDFTIVYNLYKLEDSNKGLHKPNNLYHFEEEDNSVKKQIIENNSTELVVNLTRSVEDKGIISKYNRGNPVATLYYDFKTQKPIFISGYYTGENSSETGTEFTW